jgi:hypothetical protein
MGKFGEMKDQAGEQAKKAAKDRLSGDRERNKLREDEEQMGQRMPDHAGEAEERMRGRGGRDRERGAGDERGRDRGMGEERDRDRDREGGRDRGMMDNR